MLEPRFRLLIVLACAIAIPVGCGPSEPPPTIDTTSEAKQPTEPTTKSVEITAPAPKAPVGKARRK
jgi:hypothetical protein